jgi:hypothetical protein
MQEEGSDSSSCFLNGQLTRTIRLETDQQKEIKRSMEEILRGTKYCSFSATINKAVILTPHDLASPVNRQARATSLQQQRFSFHPNPEKGTTRKGICPDKQCSPLSLLDSKRP